MANLEIQQHNINKLIAFTMANPELEIVPMVDSECIQGDDFAYWMAGWGTAKIDEYHCSDERIYFKEYDFEELVEDFIDNNYEYHKNLSEDELQELAEREVSNLEWTKAIVVHINAI